MNPPGLGAPAARPIQGPKNAFQVKADGGAELIKRPNIRETLTAKREVDVHTALVRSLAEYLVGRKMDRGGQPFEFKAGYYDTAEPEEKSAFPAFNVAGTNRGMYDAKSLTPNVDRRPISDSDNRYFVSSSEFVQDLGIQLYTTSVAERLACMALLEEALAPVQWMYGFRLRCPYYYGAFASFEPDGNEYADSGEAAMKRSRQGLVVVRARIQVLQLKTFAKGDPRFRSEVDGLKT